jgi:hypothetical protein
LRDYARKAQTNSKDIEAFTDKVIFVILVRMDIDVNVTIQHYT